MRGRYLAGRCGSLRRRLWRLADFAWLVIPDRPLLWPALAPGLTAGLSRGLCGAGLGERLGRFVVKAA
jgi:hypothetical protein